MQRLGPRVALAALLSAALLQASCASSAGGPVGGPGRPTHVNASAWTTSAIVRWQAPAKTGTAPIVAYRVVSEPAQVAAVFAGDQTWGAVRGLTNGVAYTFTVTAVNGAKRTSPASPRSNRVMPSPVVVHVRGNQLVDGEGRGVRLFGVNRSGTEYSCVIGGAQGAGIFSGPSGAASIAAMASWRINAVRVPLNEDCWLGINGVNPAYSGRSYRDAIVAYVERLNRAGLVAVLDLHWNAPGTVLSEGQQVMADADHSPAFWASVATTFLAYAGVMFDLYNEPKDVSWECWRSGCVSPPGWRTAGMQSLIEVVRATGARQPIVVSGLNNANDLSRWLDAGLADPLHQLVAGLHMYNTGPPGYCNASPCWDATVAPVAARVPVITTEVGEFDRGSAFVTGYLDWAEAQARIGRDVSYAAWSWDVALGVGGPSLVSSYDGVPTAFGTGIRAYFQGLWERGEIQQG